MRLYALVSLETERSVDVYPTFEEAYAALADVRADDPVLAGVAYRARACP
jgi:hypothetical protein